MGRWQDAAYFDAKAAGTLPWHEPRFADLYQDGAWSGEDVWIIGGGPSIGDLDLQRLTGRKVIGVNMAFLRYEPTFLFVGSVLLLQRLISRGRPNSDIVSPLVVHERAVWNLNNSLGGYVLEVEDQDCEWGTTLARGVPAFSNSGVMATNIADILGARRIFLLGFDMKGGDDGRTSNFHSVYPDSMRPPAVVYRRYIRDFERGKPHARAEIFNCAPDSALTCFPRMDFEESLR